MVVIRIASNPRFLTVVRAMLSEVCELIKCSRENQRKIVLAVDEACSNIIKHTCMNDPGKTIEISCSFEDGKLLIELKDDGPPVDPATIQPRDLSDLRPGGLGTHFIRSVMDEVVYSFDKETGNVLKLAKNLEIPDPGPEIGQKQAATPPDV
jgi:anti-sigma regulatory factor (Ser/Thr protein kinase)